MSLNTVTLTFTVQDAAADAGAGQVQIAPTSVVTAAGVTVVSQAPILRTMSAGSLSVELVACDNDGTVPAAGFWAYLITLPGGQPQAYLVNFGNGATQRFDDLTPVVAQTTYAQAAGSGGTVTDVSVATANGFAGTVATASTTPAVTVETTVTGLLKGNGTAVSAATAGTDYLSPAGGTLTGDLAPAVATLTDAATIAVNAALGNDFRVTLGGNRTMGAPSNAVDGQKIIFQVKQDGSGSRTLAWASGAGGYDFGSGSAPALSTAAGDIDLAAFVYNAAKGEWLSLGSALGF